MAGRYSGHCSSSFLGPSKFTVSSGHEDMIHDAQVDVCCRRLATASADRNVRIFDINSVHGTSSLIAVLEGHEGPVWQVAWGHPTLGNLLASCSFDRKVIIWQERAKESTKFDRIFTYDGHESSVNSVCWAPHEYGLMMLACGSSDGNISVLSLPSEGRGNNGGSWVVQKILGAHVLGCNAVSWAPAIRGDSFEEESQNQKRLASGGCDNFVKVWKEVDNHFEEECHLVGHSDWVRDVAWAPCHGQGLSRTRIASCGQDKQVIIWTPNGDGGSKWDVQVLPLFEDVIWHVSWNITGDILAASGGDNQVSIWKLNKAANWECLSDLSEETRRYSAPSSPAAAQPNNAYSKRPCSAPSSEIFRNMMGRLSMADPPKKKEGEPPKNQFKRTREDLQRQKPFHTPSKFNLDLLLAKK